MSICPEDDSLDAERPWRACQGGSPWSPWVDSCNKESHFPPVSSNPSFPPSGADPSTPTFLYHPPDRELPSRPADLVDTLCDSSL